MVILEVITAIVNDELLQNSLKAISIHRTDFEKKKKMKVTKFKNHIEINKFYY